MVSLLYMQLPFSKTVLVVPANRGLDSRRNVVAAQPVLKPPQELKV